MGCAEEQAYVMCRGHWMCRGASILDVSSRCDAPNILMCLTCYVLSSTHIECAEHMIYDEHIICAEQHTHGMCQAHYICIVLSTRHCLK